jgi:hypothetical protein
MIVVIAIANCIEIVMVVVIVVPCGGELLEE